MMLEFQGSQIRDAVAKSVINQDPSWKNKLSRKVGGVEAGEPDEELAKLIYQETDMVESRKSLKAVHDAIKDKINGEGTEDSPYQYESGGKHSYIGIFALVESVLRKKDVFIKVKGVEVKVNGNEFTYESGNPDSELDSVDNIIGSIKSPVGYFVAQAKEARGR